MVSSISGIAGMENYRISSIHGNPYSLNAISRIGEESSQSGKPLVIEAQEKDDLYVKDYGELSATSSTATGDFAELLSIQEDMLSTTQETAQSDSNASYYNDLIGMMGYQNSIRAQLGTAFIPFS